MSALDKLRKFEHEFAETMAEGFWTPKDPLSEEELDRLENVRKELSDLQTPTTPDGSDQ